MGFLSGPLGGAGAGAGAGAAVNAGASPVASVAPPPQSNLMSTLFPKLLAARSGDPALQNQIAKEMAAEGMSPEQFKESTNHLKRIIQPSSVSPSGKPYDIQAASGDKFVGQNVVGDLMKKAGGAAESGVKSGVGSLMDLIPTGAAQPQKPTMLTQETPPPLIGETMQPQGATERVTGKSPPTWRGVDQVPTAPGQAPIASPPGQLPIAPPIQPPVVPQTLPAAIREMLKMGPLGGPRESMMAGTPSEGTVTGTTPQSSGTVTGGTTSDGQLSPLGGQLLQPSPLQAQSVQPTWTGQTSYQLHGGATRTDALRNMDRQFMQQLEEMYGAAPPEVQKELGLTSAFRDVETQRRLWEKSDKSGRSVAQPGGSRHNYGKAADLYGFGMGKERVSPETFKWVQQNAKSFGLGFPVKGEPWHIEQISQEGKRIPLTPGILPDEIAQRGAIPQFGLEQRQATGARGMQAVRGLRPELRELMSTIGPSYGVDPMYLQTIAMLESGGNPDAHNASGADGLMQFMPGTAKQYRVTNTRDAKDSIRGASELAADNIRTLKKELGRDPSWAEVYLAHQQGGAGAAALLKNPNEMAVNTLGRDAVIGNGGTSGMTNQEFANLWIDKYNGTASGKGGGGGGGDTTASVGEQFGPPYNPAENPLNKFPPAPSNAPSVPEGYDASALEDVAAGDKEKPYPAPSPVPPSQGSYKPDSDMMKLMMMMLMSGMGGQIPTIGQIMGGARMGGGGGGGGNG